MSNLIFGLSDTEYHATPRLNNSGIKKLLKSPMHYLDSKLHPQEPTKAMAIGSAVHCMTLEPETFLDRYAVAPESLDKRTKEGKAAWAELEASGKIILSNADYQDINKISFAVRTHETAPKLINAGNPEVSVFTTMDSVDVKCRFDWLRPIGDDFIAVDLKTTDDASQAGFAKSIANYGYDIQAAWYIDCAKAAGIEIVNFIFIVVEKSSPYAVALYELDEESIEAGRAKYQKALNTYKDCIATGEWQGYSSNIETIRLPAWALKEAA